MGPGKVRKMLLDLLKTAGLPDLTAENENYNAENRIPFTRFGFEPVETLVLTTGSPNPHQQLYGLIRVSLFRPRGVGMDALYVDADKVLAKFPPSTYLTHEDGESVHVLISWVESVIQEDDWVQLPIFVRWLALEQAPA